MRGVLARFCGDESGGMVDEIVSIALLIIIGGAILRALAGAINDAIYAVIAFIQTIMPGS